MKLTCSGSKNSPKYYIPKTVRINGKSTTKTIEKLGGFDELKQRFGEVEPITKAKDYVKKLTLDEKNERKSILIQYSPVTLIDKNIRRSCNIGYLFLRDIYYSIGIDKICQAISKKYKFEFDLNEIFSLLIFTRVIAPSSKRASLSEAMSFLEQSTSDLHQVYRALEVIAKENDFIQSNLYNRSLSVIERKKDVLYYDCTNYYFEIEKEDTFRRYDFSKEHRPNPIVQMGLFMDSDGIPLSFSVFSGNENEQQSMTPLEKKIISDFNSSKFIVCTDAGLSSSANHKFNSIVGRGFVTTQSIKKLKSFLKDFCLSDEGWKLIGSNKVYRLSELNSEMHYDKTFYKDRWICENGLEQHLIVTYSIKYKEYQRNIRQSQIEGAKKIVEQPSYLKKKNINNPKRFVDELHFTNTGEVASKTITSLKQSQIDEEARYDGFYCVCTNVEQDIEKILKINQKRWEIEECFRIMKHELKARPIYLSREDRILAHFTTCFIALIVYRILEKKLNETFTCTDTIKTLRDMNMMIIPGYGYIPIYKRTAITDALHEIFKFRTDYQIITQKDMRKILNITKKGEK